MDQPLPPAGAPSTVYPAGALPQGTPVNPCDKYDRPDAPPLGWRRVLTQACHDLFGTKDVQNVITASYVWMADQIGHLALGFVPTLFLTWSLARAAGFSPPIRATLSVIVAGLVFAYWVKKEFADREQTRTEAGTVFPYNSGDIDWNVETALLYFGLGGLFAVVPNVRPALLLPVLLVALYPAGVVAFWWLQRKLAFQQAGLPFLFRLANFTTALPEGLPMLIGDLANISRFRVRLWHVLLRRPTERQGDPTHRHVVIAGTLGAGKTSLCTGIGTEFAFALGKARYLSATKLVERAAAATQASGDREVDGGQILWTWQTADLLLVDDLDIATAGGAPLITPASLLHALGEQGAAALAAFGARRSVWVVGDPGRAAAWRDTIAGLLGVHPSQVAIAELGETPRLIVAPPPAELEADAA